MTRIASSSCISNLKPKYSQISETLYVTICIDESITTKLDQNSLQIIPPNNDEYKPIQVPDTFILKRLLRQNTKPLQNSGITRLTFMSKCKNGMTLGEYSELASVNDRRIVGLSLDDREAIFWEEWDSTPIYAIDNEISLCPPNDEWNLNNFDHGSLICSRGVEELIRPGMNTPYTNFGMFGTCAGMHNEDGYLASINRLHSGAVKTW